MNVDDRELINLIKLAKKGDIKATFEIILIFEKNIDRQCYINGKFNQECKDYIIDKLFEKIKNFKKI